MKFLKVTYITIISLFILNSCVVQKRLHLNGYHVNWKNNSISSTNQPIYEVASIDENNFEASSIIEKSKISFLKDSAIVWFTSLEICDTIILKNQDTIIAKITKQDNFKVKYKRCERKSGEYFNISKSEISKINYSDGRIEQFNEIIEQKENSINTEKLLIKNKVKSDDNNKIHSFALASSISSFIGLIGLLLLFKIGILFLPFFIIGAIFGSLALKKIKKEPNELKSRDKYLATIGFYIGVTFILLTLVALIVLLSFLINEFGFF